MGLSDQQPYLYDPPNRRSNAYKNPWDPYDGFNPKAVSQASMVPTPPRPKAEGPLVNFNRHPDSYFVLPPVNKQSNAKSMHPNTKRRIARARNIQLGLRFLQLIGAVGILICVICVKTTRDTEGWIIRLPPGIDILLTLYAIYHLARKARERTPSSSASYHFFALFMDTGLIPFYVFTALLGNAHFHEVPGTKGRWTSFFNSDQATTDLIQATWLVATADAALHACAIVIDLYLLVMFRKIANLPPDMNPLESTGNLTSRKKSKHKYKNSEATLLPVEDKRFSDATTINGSPNRQSRASDALGAFGKRGSNISFVNSRADQDDSFSPHNPKTAHMSRISVAEEPNLYYQLNAASSRINLDSSPYRNSHDSHYRDSQEQHLLAGPPYLPSPVSRHSVQTTPTRSVQNSPTRNSPTRNSRPQSHASQAHQDNWFVIGAGSDVSSEHGSELDSAPAPFAPVARRAPHAAPLLEAAAAAREAAAHEAAYAPLARDSPAGNPLRMNPLTPPLPTPTSAKFGQDQGITTQLGEQMLQMQMEEYAPLPRFRSGTASDDEDDHDENFQGDEERSRTMMSNATTSTYASTESGGLTAPPRGKFYGDLASARRGVRRQDAEPGRPKSLVGSVHYADTANGSHGRRGELVSASGTVVRKPVRSAQVQDGDEVHDSQRRIYGGAGRVVSRTGVDVGDNGANGVGLGRRQRDVSGKVAEEGRSKGWAMFRRGSMKNQ